MVAAHVRDQGFNIFAGDTDSLFDFLLTPDGAMGALAVRYRCLARETWRALQVRFTRARRAATIERLRAERSAIYETVAQLAEDLQLPGSVAADGRIVESND